MNLIYLLKLVVLKRPGFQSQNMVCLPKPFLCKIQSLKAVTETRPETFETETRKNGSREESRVFCQK